MTDTAHQLEAGNSEVDASDHLGNALEARRITDDALKEGSITSEQHRLLTSGFNRVISRYTPVDPMEGVAHQAQTKANRALLVGEINPDEHALLTRSFVKARKSAEDRTRHSLRVDTND